MNSKTDIFILSNVFSNFILSIIDLINFFHQNCLISQQNGLRIDYTLRTKIFAISNENEVMPTLLLLLRFLE